MELFAEQQKIPAAALQLHKHHSRNSHLFCCTLTKRNPHGARLCGFRFFVWSL